ncbi:OsmC-like protein [Flavobacterium enshiense DK69]|uniref:Osmotically inducible protein OsmC n=1 Tax=Flavobacterium enshiense DK69 TaxID=1107311 RepID=V6SDR4_9FLAO|nr:OsmC family protein [Flavobacterium enshiense]ESU24402.1 OsmC-like protein [Flavobacterium enshiense DK69]KGO94508.1 osmotically inducible protein OsmC [Flavobacterium enshiense DK69]
MDTHKVITSWKGKMKFESDNPSGDTIAIDAGPDSGGDGCGLRPKAMMLSALAGCTGLDVASLIEKMKLEVEDFRIDTEGDLTEEHPKSYHTVRVNYHFFGKNLDEKKLERAVNLSVEKYCGVMVMFRQFAKVEINIEFHKN